MPVFDLLSKRRRRAERAGQPDVYQYDKVPQLLRGQIAHILNDALGHVIEYDHTGASERWQTIVGIITREKGVFELGRGSYQRQCINWFLREASDEDALDLIDIGFAAVRHHVDELDEATRRHLGIELAAKDAIEELNTRLREHGVGYQFEGYHLIRVDSQFVHAEVIKPALDLLSGKIFDTARSDFHTAHQHYRDGKHKDAVVAAQRAFESTLKAICTAKGWVYGKGDRSSDLIKLVRAKGLFPDFLGAGFDSYIAMMKTGLPEVRNNAGGHGSDPGALPPPAFIAAYAPHTTASNIVLLGEAMRATGK